MLTRPSYRSVLVTLAAAVIGVPLGAGTLPPPAVSPTGGGGSAATVIYVNASATGASDGSSWDDAFTSLQDALDAATDPAEIWVASGTYYPDRGANVSENNVSERFKLKSGVNLYGGFVGNETSREQRDPDPETNGTILCGNIDDDPGDGVFYNSLRVVEIKDIGTMVLDGFTISDGGRPGLSDSADGVGIAVDNANVIYLANLRIVDNYGRRYVGLDIAGAGTEVVMKNVAIARNEDDAVAVRNQATATLIDCRIVANTGRAVFVAALATVLIVNSTLWDTVGAGLVTAVGAEATVQGVSIKGNDNTGSSGGGVSNGGSLVLVNSDISGNAAANGAALYNAPNASAIVIGNTLQKNEATGSGGAVSNFGDLTFDGNYVLDNDASTGGGIANAGVLRGMNNVIARNDAASGGGFYGVSGGDATFVNTTISFNVSSSTGGGAHARTGTTASFLNSIVSGNSAQVGSQFNLDPSSTVEVGHTAVEGGLPGAINDLGGNIDVVVTFVDHIGNDFTLTGPGIDAGNNSLVPADVNDIDADNDTLESYPVTIRKHISFSDYFDTLSDVFDSSPFDFLSLSHTNPACVGQHTNFVTRAEPPIESGVIDYGDGSQTSNVSGPLVPSHVYQEEGLFDATISVETDSTSYGAGYASSLVFVERDCEEERIQSGGTGSGEAVVDMGASEVPGTSVSREQLAPVASQFTLSTPSPNPTQKRSVLVARVPDVIRIRVEMFDVLGRRVRMLYEGAMPSGRHEIAINRNGLAAGQYLVLVRGSGIHVVQSVTFLD